MGRLGWKQKFLLMVALIFLALGPATLKAACTMDDYCVVPSFVTTTLKPNVLVLMDFSGSMQFPAYVPCYNTGYDGYVAECSSHHSDETAHGTTAYNINNDYYGYFDYKKDSSGNSKYYKWSSDRFQVNTACTNTDRIGSGSDCISGNLLNWITATRIDSARKVLTGGRTSTGGGGLKYESEGSVYTYTDKNLHCKFTVTAVTTANRSLKIENETGYTCPISLSSSTINIDESDATRATGVLQAFEDKAVFEFMVFAGDSRYGEIRSGKDATFSSLLAAINNESPYWGTPTGPGMWEASDFFKQVASDSAWHSTNYENNSDNINKTSGNKDPYYDGTGKPGTKMPCRKTYVLLISDGNWNEGPDPVKPAHKMHISDLRSDLEGIQNATTYVVYAFGDLDSGTRTLGRNAMITTAIFGGFDRTDETSWPYPFTDYPANSQNVTYPLTNCNPSGTWNEQCKKWDKNKSGLPYNFYEADEGEGLTASIAEAFNDMMRKASSGTAASVLASSEGSGANLFQAVFYPKRVFGEDEATWIGEIHDLWYYVDPFLDNASLREDTTDDKILDLSNDYVIRFYYDSGLAKTRIQKWTDSNHDGSGDVLSDSDDLEDVKSLWSAGTKLFERNLSSSPRKIYTTLNGTSFLTGDFSEANWSTLKDYLGSSVDEATAKKIINYVTGLEQTGTRNRTVTLGTTTGPWRLGDIISSTPRMQSMVPLNSYHRAAPDGYGDYSYSQYINDSTSTGYKQRGMVYAGANDGMLHAFHLGLLEEKWTGQTADQKGKLTQLSGKEVGAEAWAFIPKHSLPYLQYLANSAYCHLYYIDLPPVLLDASINGNAGDTKTKDSWRTVVVGGMGLGGAPRKQSDSCSTNNDCVKAPMDDPGDSTKALGYSSYFAIDVTDPVNPILLWEFAHPDLGYSTSGPAIIRVGDSTKNGSWFVVVASGPTGPVDKAYRQFLGRSDQNLRLFVLDLKTGTLMRTIDTGIENAFGGSLYNATVDVDRWRAGAPGHYKDDGLYFGFTKKASDGTWTNGGVLRLLTKESADVSSWAASYVKNDIGPVTSAVTRLQSTKDSSLWLYFGTGRFFYKRASDVDDPDNQRTLYGVKEKCYTSGNTLDSSCTTAVGSLKNQTDSPGALGSTDEGWYINLPTSVTIEDQVYKAERVMTDPAASFNGAVFFTTFAPSADVCAMGGNTFLWAVKYNTGGEPPQLRGKALLQVSSGEIKEISLGSAFKTSSDNSDSKGNRRSASIKGVPPTRQGLSLLVAPKPIQKVLHIREK
ncbi:MAG: hypothetical protein A4E58_03289 [Syntrophorhabdus sp. PtaB.Bin006]|nr:MAG: hypothetical protein A4E58_03289 [Syntrophorhabdus sp. PtaB.Bin006]